ncbi:MAG: MFS transporter [Lentisphaerae bacterium]|jgi:MFS family permease|nr:MFS transporter [Lentisphaerota bacterium]MBT4822660.1 MFS transporter [Lentisphaerota bacterium]MBT5612996.1 MFS transporter [Lentisphaerota bacterium]MBT7061537.1 MFS transporter [Lentisphaerota bacterium]MBT7847971.1 MFS transporter [Lentisphaerota bacterium]
MEDTKQTEEETLERGQAVSPQQRRGMRFAILTQMSGTIAQLSFKSGMMLLYLRALGVPSTRILVYVSFPGLAYVLSVPAAYLADRFGKKRLAVPALAVSACGFGLVAMAGSFAGTTREVAAVLGTVVFSVAQVPFSASWYALLSPVVPEYMRGRFFGRLRVSWQAVGVAFTAVCALVLSEEAPPSTYQWLFAVVTVGQVLKLLIYRGIPELEQPRQVRTSLAQALSSVLHAPRYLPFCSYVFLLMLFTAAGPSVFALVEKEVLHFGDNLIVWLGNLAMVGSVTGFLLGGKAVDRHGTKPVFLISHFAYGIVMALFMCRAVAPEATFVWVGGVHFGFGLIFAASSIAITTEILELLPDENKSLAGAVAQSLYVGGSALSSVLAAWVLKLGVLRESWSLGRLSMTSYDAVLLGYAGMVMLLVVTLGQVPSVLRKHEWLPGAR